MLSRNIFSFVTQLNVVQKLSRNLEMRFYTVPAGTPGAGAGKGGGAGGSVRSSGGGLGKYGAAQEEGYFFNKQRQQLEKLKQNQKKESEQEIKNKEEKGDN